MDGNEKLYDFKKRSDASGVEGGVSSTVQADMADADINTIVRRFGLVGEMPEALGIPQYGDFTGISDYRSALDAIGYAQEQFAQIPAEIRAKFQNDPGEWMSWIHDPANVREAISLGFAVEIPHNTSTSEIPPKVEEKGNG